MDKRSEKFDWADKLSVYLKKVESSKWYRAYIQKLLIHDIEKKEPCICELLHRNRELENIYKGKRCFILGNGPSLNNINFKYLSKEIVFTVNQLPEHPLFGELHSNYHIITDLQAFGLRYGKDELTPGFTKYSLDLMKSLSEKGNPTLIVPYQVRRILQQAGIASVLSVKYICLYKAFVDGYHECDLTKPISSFSGVVLSAILCAMYMGVSEIYLLGCDETFIIDTLECALENGSKYGHAYSDPTGMDDKGYRILANSLGIQNLIASEYRRHAGFEQLYYYCRKNGVHIYNLSVPTLIDSIPKRKFENVIKNNLEK